ncbi:hypothetical protein L9F63_017258 [Diploptera punctata]|uniref:Uncharacterized protein n=1 Tax=Diploptera punctata TaxID=6984 RepID=A0AAD7ZZ88_DIPPU|nr:hypothetical protein L9F63_017258 [Diploptera punctata]
MRIFIALICLIHLCFSIQENINIADQINFPKCPSAAENECCALRKEFLAKYLHLLKRHNPECKEETRSKVDLSGLPPEQKNEFKRYCMLFCLHRKQGLVDDFGMIQETELTDTIIKLLEDESEIQDEVEARMPTIARLNNVQREYQEQAFILKECPMPAFYLLYFVLRIIDWRCPENKRKESAICTAYFENIEKCLEKYGPEN